MTVTKGKQSYSFPTHSGNTSEAESLHLGNTSGSDNESLRNEPGLRVRPFASAGYKNHLTDEMVLKKNSGRKKLRRYKNRCSLQTLAEEAEDEGVFIIIMDQYKTPFGKLLEDSDALEFWNTFIEKSEDEQAKLLAPLEKHRTSCTAEPTERSSSRIASKIKRTIKIKKNLSLEQVKLFEDEVITFFKMTPREIYVRSPPTYFERLLLHAIAQYHDLRSIAMMEGGNRRVEVYNTLKDWNPAEHFLTDFVAQLRK